MSGISKYINWELVLEDRCPACGEVFEKSGGDFICHNHKGQPFKIGGAKMAQVKRRTQLILDSKMPKFEF